MTQLTATPNTGTGSVTLDILKTSDVTKVVRMNVNGTEEVRTSQGQLPSSAASSIVRTNLVPNPSFETNISNYTSNSMTLARVTTGGLFGTGYMRGTTTASTPDHTTIHATYSLTLTGGKSYIATFYTRTTIPLSWSGWTWVQVGGNELNKTLGTYPADASGWRRHYVKFTVPGTGSQVTTLQPGVYQTEADPNTAPAVPMGTTVDFDGLLVEEGSTLADYFDGDTADTSGFDYLWTGTPHASTSTLQTIGGRLILTDYEAAHGTNTYNVYAADGSMITGSVDLVIDKPWLSVPVMPQYSEQVETITQFGAGRESNTTVHRPLGRADSLVVMGKLGDRTGSLEVFCNSYTDARRLERIFERGEVVQLRQRVAEVDMYFTVTSIPVSPYSVQGEDATRWAMVLNYVEVRRPIGQLAGALGWTFDAMASSAASFDVITAHYDTFDALTLGDANV